MRALIVGLGSIGRRHLRNLRNLDPSAHITVWHLHSKLTDDLGALPEADARVFDEAKALASKPDVAIISCPANLHIKTSLSLAERGVHLFIEKPLSNALDGIDALEHLSAQRSLVVMVGYNFRFYAPLQIMRQALATGAIGRVLFIRAEVGQYLPDWRPTQDYRLTVSARKELGGGVLLELSHELDYVTWLNGDVKTVSAQVDLFGDLDIDVEDTAEIILRFRNGALGSIHLDMLQRSASRTCCIVGTEGTLAWDAMSNRVQRFSATKKIWEDLHPETSMDRNQMYVAELRHFLECVRENKAPAIGLSDGKRVLQIALAARRSSEEGRVVNL